MLLSVVAATFFCRHSQLYVAKWLEPAPLALSNIAVAQYCRMQVCGLLPKLSPEDWGLAWAALLSVAN